MGRFFDTRAAYTMFVNSTDEKSVVADRVATEAGGLQVSQPGLRIFDAGMGDGALLTNVMRRLHRRFPFVPWLVVAKEISIEDLRQGLARLADRFVEHPETVVVVTNLRFNEAAQMWGEGEVRWTEAPLVGDTSVEFADQIRALYPQLALDWEVRTDPKSGNPTYRYPATVVLYRQDHGFLLKPLIPQPGSPVEFDLVIAAQAYRAKTSLVHKVKWVVAPLARALAPDGLLVGVQSAGEDPGAEIIEGVWPGEESFPDLAADVSAEAERQLGRDAYEFEAPGDRFRFSLHTMPPEEAAQIGTSSVVAAWNAATYVAQIDEDRLALAMASGDYLEVTREVMEKYGQVWWNDEMFLIRRRTQQGPV